jgi:nucleoside-diphosphate-sugar epimerase
MNVLITGAAGRIGQEVLKELLPRGLALRGIDVQPSPLTTVEWMTADIRDLAQMERACAGVEAVIHLAAIPGPGARPLRMGWTSCIATFWGLTTSLKPLCGRACGGWSVSA